MSFAFQRRRGTTAQHASFTGLLGEVTVDTDKKVTVVHDGSTAGGFPMARAQGGSLADATTRGLEEDINVVASAATGTINLTFKFAVSPGITISVPSDKVTSPVMSDVPIYN